MTAKHASREGVESSLVQILVAVATIQLGDRFHNRVEDWSGEGFHANSSRTWVSRS